MLFLNQWAALPLRLIVGYGFIVHGWAKLSRGPDTFSVVLHTLGVPAPHLLAWLTTLVELAGGFAMLAGAFVALASLPMAVVLLTALYTVHLPYDRDRDQLLPRHPGQDAGRGRARRGGLLARRDQRDARR